jgi:hypothetical protein
MFEHMMSSDRLPKQRTDHKYLMALGGGGQRSVCLRLIQLLGLIFKQGQLSACAVSTITSFYLSREIGRELCKEVVC